MIRGGCIYFMSNQYRTVLYLGVTSDLIRRVQEHKNKVYPGSFTDRYNLHVLVYHENFLHIEEAIAREKEVKKWRREKKNALISSMNPGWKDLWETEVRYW